MERDVNATCKAYEQGRKCVSGMRQGLFACSGQRPNNNRAQLKLSVEVGQQIKNMYYNWL